MCRVRLVLALVWLVGCGGDDDAVGSHADAGGRVDGGGHVDARPTDAAPPADDAATADSCTALASAAGAVIDALSEDGVQDIPAAITPTLSTVLIQRSDICTTFALLVADASGPDTFQIVDATTALASLGLDPAAERTLALTADGLTVIGVTADRLQLSATTRSGVGLIDFGAPDSTAFAALAAADGQTLLDPVLSSDGLAFYFTLLDDNPDVAGVYESVRASVADPFPAATRMPAAVQQAGIVTGISSDRLFLFLEKNFAMSGLRRTSLEAPFDIPVAGLPGFRGRPTADCAALIASCTSAGCAGEDICRFAP
jgi:hypothetical protein